MYSQQNQNTKKKNLKDGEKLYTCLYIEHVSIVLSKLEDQGYSTIYFSGRKYSRSIEL